MGHPEVPAPPPPPATAIPDKAPGAPAPPRDDPFRGMPLRDTPPVTADAAAAPPPPPAPPALPPGRFGASATAVFCRGLDTPPGLEDQLPPFPPGLEDQQPPWVGEVTWSQPVAAVAAVQPKHGPTWPTFQEEELRSQAGKHMCMRWWTVSAKAIRNVYLEEKRAQKNKLKNGKVCKEGFVHPYPEKDEDAGYARWRANRDYERAAMWNGMPQWYAQLPRPPFNLHPGETYEHTLDYTRQPFNGWWLLPHEDQGLRGGGARSCEWSPRVSRPVPMTFEGVKVWPLEFFKNNRKLLAFGDPGDLTRGKYINSQAMKFFRDMCEGPMGVPSEQYPLGLNLTFRDFDVVAMQLPHMIHDGGPDGELKTSMSWSWDYTKEKVWWGWQRMLAALPDEALEQLVGEDDGANRGGGVRGITACKFMPRLGSYDHKRHSVYSEEGRPVQKGTVIPLWDFVFFTTEGNIVGLRPGWNSYAFHVHYYQKGGIPVTTEAERSQMLGAPGESVGPGTYNHYKVMEVDAEWKAMSWQAIDQMNR